MANYMLPPGYGKSVSLGGLGVNFKVYGEDTAGSFAIVEHPIEPGVLVRPHTHTNEDEYSYVLEGEVGARIGDQELLATPGSYILKPRGIQHTFWNPGPRLARIIEIISPAGFEGYFAELGELLASGGPPDFAAIEKLGARYGLIFSMEWVPELMAKYNLNPPRGNE